MVGNLQLKENKFPRDIEAQARKQNSNKNTSNRMHKMILKVRFKWNITKKYSNFEFNLKWRSQRDGKWRWRFIACRKTKTKQVFIVKTCNKLRHTTWSLATDPDVSYSPSNELWDEAEAVPVLDSRFSWVSQRLVSWIMIFISIFFRHFSAR